MGQLYVYAWVTGPAVPGAEQLADEDPAGMSAWRIRVHRAGNSCGGLNGRLKPA